MDNQEKLSTFGHISHRKETSKAKKKNTTQNRKLKK
jgi:hypothetical protein